MNTNENTEIIKIEDFDVSNNIVVSNDVMTPINIIQPPDYSIMDENIAQFYPQEKPFERVIGWFKL